jgi:hypothetical protein
LPTLLEATDGYIPASSQYGQKEIMLIGNERVNLSFFNAKKDITFRHIVDDPDTSLAIFFIRKSPNVTTLNNDFRVRKLLV